MIGDWLLFLVLFGHLIEIYLLICLNRQVSSLPRMREPSDAPRTVTYPLEAQTQNLGQVELLCRTQGEGWQHHSWRPATHRDVAEALATPGLAVRHSDGTVEEGQQ